jgi:hypothetical protein
MIPLSPLSGGFVSSPPRPYGVRGFQMRRPQFQDIAIDAFLNAKPEHLTAAACGLIRTAKDLHGNQSWGNFRR